jgi:hypothetical protein
MDKAGQEQACRPACPGVRNQHSRKAPEIMDTLVRHFATLVEIARLPVAALRFHAAIDPVRIAQEYHYVTKRHPRYRVIQNKSVGAALIDLKGFGQRDRYLEGITGKNLGAYHAKRARSRGYVLAEIDRNRYIDDIHAINTSVETRQGQPMTAQYLQKVEHFEPEKHFKYFGILSSQGTLMAYGNLGFYGNFCAFSQLIGRRNNDGIMHLLVVDIVCRLIDEGTLNYIMYDTFFGARPGLKQFKTIVGFKPYRAKYSIQK